MQEDWNNDV